MLNIYFIVHIFNFSDYPEVTAVKDWIHGAVDLKIELACKVLANPPPKVSKALPVQRRILLKFYIS